MAGTKIKRPKKTDRNRAYQFRLADAEATAFDALVERRAAQAAAAGGTANSATVLRGLVLSALADEEGLLSKTEKLSE
jgi:hypothetical protein